MNDIEQMYPRKWAVVCSEIFRFACWYNIIFLLLVGGQYNVKERQQLIFETLDSTDFVVANGVWKITLKWCLDKYKIQTVF